MTMYSTLRCHGLQSATGWRVTQIRRLNNKRECMEDENKNHVLIPEFYSGKSIFITGGTGLIGRLIIEKLSYSCPNIEKIYMLIRANSEEHAKQRVQTMIKGSPLIERLERKKIESKIVPILGELGSPGLGIHKRDVERIANEASIVIHGAATITFNEPLQLAMSYNVNGTRDVLSLAKKLKNIEAFVHVSTAYCVATPERKEIHETVYPIPDINVVIDKVNKTLEEYKDRDLPSDIMGGASNSYVFTKCIAENLVAEASRDLPVAIVRPTLVSSCMREPVEGYLGAVNAHSHIVYYIANGIIPLLYAKPDNAIDFIPADYVCNTIILAAANASRSKEIMVYNSASSYSNPLLFVDLSRTARSFFYKPFYPSLFFTDSQLLWRTVMYMRNILPGYFLGIGRKIRGRKSRIISFQKYLLSMLTITNDFYRHSWRIRNENVCNLYKSLSAADKQAFPCDPSDIVWRKYLINYIQSISEKMKKGDS